MGEKANHANPTDNVTGFITTDNKECHKYSDKEGVERIPNAPNPNDPSRIDIFKDTPIRYLGYANEVGESFRALVHVNVVRFSYVVASGYVVADAADAGYHANQEKIPTETKNRAIAVAVTDTLIWQGLASVIIPGFTINRICSATNMLLKVSTRLPPNTRKWTTTCIGLASIPWIIKPIDRSVHFLMDRTFRKWVSK